MKLRQFLTRRSQRKIMNFAGGEAFDETAKIERIDGETAVDVSLENVPHFGGRTLIAIDRSGSMIGRPMKTGSVLAAVLYKANDADLMLFSDDAEYVTLNKNEATLTIAARIESRVAWSGTNFDAIFERADGVYDRVVILSDMQAWIGGRASKKTFESYVRKAGHRPRVYSIDLTGFGTLDCPEREVYALSGCPDKTLDTLKFLEKEKRAVIRENEKFEL